MAQPATTPSPRQAELLDAAYRYVVENGISDLSLRPLAAAIGSSPRVLLFLFDSKDGLIRALLARARADELTVLDRVRATTGTSVIGLTAAAERVWAWLAADEHRPVLRLWTEAYARSLVEPDGAWSGFAAATVNDWLDLFADCQSESERRTAHGAARRTMVLAVLRGALLDLLATGDKDRTTRAVTEGLAALAQPPSAS